MNINSNEISVNIGNGASQSAWSINAARNLYRTWQWGSGFFSVNNDGRISVHPEGDKNKSWDLYDLVQRVAETSAMPPMLMRFPGIICTRVRDLNNAFKKAIDEFHYDGRYVCVFPVKVNQFHSVVQTVLDAIRPFGGGLEAGSKAELFAVVAMTDEHTPILCNGYKDSDYLEMALHACSLGRKVTIVVEKLDEAPRLIAASKNWVLSLA